MDHKVSRIVPHFTSRDLEKSKAFYLAFLGLELAMDMGWILTFASRENPEVQISALKRESNMEQAGTFSITMEVSAIDQIYHRALAAGYQIPYPLTPESWGVRRFHIIDPNGVLLNIMSHQ